MILRTNIFRAAFIAMSVMSIISCGGEQKPAPSVEKAKPYQRISPNFNADSAYYFVEKQVSFGPRVTNSEAHKKCGDWMVAELKKFTPSVIEQKTQLTNFDGKKLNVRNIIAEFNPKATKRILLCAHWDSRPYADQEDRNSTQPIDGANDGASGVGVLIEIARILKSVPTETGVDIVLFDAEDLGKSEHENSYCLGSQYWSANPHKPGYKADFGILLDMVGATNAKFAWEETSFSFAPQVLQRVWQTAGSLGYSNYFIYYQKGGIIDDHYYVNKNTGIPTIDIIHYEQSSTTGFPMHWHTLNDNMKVIDKNTLKAVGQTVLETVYTY